jgi:AcrR family transcriptional regulator
MSQRHDFEPADDGVLDAARACVLAVGVRRTTFSDVARRARVSRMTLYRRFPDLETVLSTLMTREFGRVVDEARAAGHSGAETVRGRAVAMVVGAASRLAADPLFARLLDVDPELLLPYVTQRLGGMQRMAVAGLAAELSGERDGSVRDGDREAMARAIELMARGFVLAKDPGIDAWDELGRAVDGYLRP